MKLDAPASPLDQWALARDIRHLNHGAFGGCPRAVIDAANAWRERLESAPMKFFVLDWRRELDHARAALAGFLHAPGERLSFVPNVTTAVAIALASSTIGAGDEIVTTDHVYRAVKNQLERLADSRGARIRFAKLPLPFDAEAAVAAITREITPQTRLALLDHVTSPTALVLPLEQIVPAFAARDIPVIVDGAHAPGQLALDVGALLSLGVTWYAGNNHKWLCAPKSSGFIVASASASMPRPIVTSHGASPEYGPSNRFHAELDWMGQHDPSAHLAVPAAIATLAGMGNGWAHVTARNHALAVEMRSRLAAALGAKTVLAPETSLGTMAAVPIELPPNTRPLALEMQLLEEGWETPIVDFAQGPLARISAHLYNHADEADALAAKLRSLGVAGR